MGGLREMVGGSCRRTGGVDGDGMMEWWNCGMEWWVVAAGGEVAAWRLYQIMSVRIVFGGTCDDSESGLRGGTPRPL